MPFESVKDKFKKVKEKIKEEKENSSGSGSFSESFFTPTMVKGEDKTTFRVRILDLGEETNGRPWHKFNFHMFEREGDARYQKCIDPRNFDSKATNPIADKAAKLFNTGNAVDNEQAKKLYRKPRYFLKVYVKSAPDNQKDYVGKVLVWEASQTIYERLIDEIDETDDEEEAPFWDPFEGKDFAVIIKKKGDWPNYDSSKFVGSSSPIVKDEKKMDEVSKLADAVNVKDTVLNRYPIKSGKEMLEMLKGGVVDLSDDNDTSAKDLTSDEEIDDTEVDFGDDDIDFNDEPKDTESKEESSDKRDDVDDEDFEFDDDDFDIDDDDDL